MVDYPDYTLPIVVIGTVVVTGTVAISGTVTVSGAVTVSGTVAVSGTVTVTGTVAVSGTVTISGTVAISGTVTISGAVTITSGSVTFTNTTIAVTGTVSITGSVTVTGTVAISGSVTITGTVAISGTVTISGAVTITSGAVTITTVGGTNIIIDKLTQGSYIERQSTISNNGDTPTLNAAPTGDTRNGKFFPRGCRGFIDTIDFYTKDLGTAGGTIYVYIAPYIGSGIVYSGTIAVPASQSEAWLSWTLRKMWKYDSLFIWFYTTADIARAYDTVINLDSYISVDAGVSWYFGTFRLWIRVIMEGQTVGDLPVSGTVNNIQLPNIASGRLYTYYDLTTTSETDMKIVNGAGHIVYIDFMVCAVTSSEFTKCRVYCDGVNAFEWNFIALNDFGFKTDTPGISLTTYAANGICCIHLTLKFEFTRQLRITMQPYLNTLNGYAIDGLASLIT